MAFAPVSSSTLFEGVLSQPQLTWHTGSESVQGRDPCLSKLVGVNALPLEGFGCLGTNSSQQRSDELAERRLV